MSLHQNWSLLPASCLSLPSQFQWGWRIFPPFHLCAQAASCHPDLPSLGVLHNVRVVLVGSQHAGNVGSACRAAANFECRDIRLVNPCCDYLAVEGHNAAANSVSRDLLQQARVEKSLAEAFEDCSMAVAFTRRTGEIRRPSFALAELKVPDDENLRLALVFGREDCGLHTHELLQCTHICTIPSGTWSGSLNLSHAVVVVLSRLYELCAGKQNDQSPVVRLHSTTYKTLPGTASVIEVENLLHRWEQIFSACNEGGKLVGNPEYKTPEKLFMFLRKLLQRARPSAREVAYLHGFLTVIELLAMAVRQNLKPTGDENLKSTRGS